MTSLITGSSGFIGNHLKRDMPEAVGIDIRPSETADVAEDICNFKSNEHWDVVYHLAALADVEESVKNPIETFRTNVCGTINVLKLNYDLLVFPSTVGVYEFAMNPYNLSKFVCEELIKASSKPYIIFRLANIYGEGSKSVVLKFINNSEMTVYGDGDQVRDFTYVDDLIEMLMDVQKLEKNKVYHVGTGEATSVNQVADLVNELMGEKPIIYLPERRFEIRRPVIKADIRCETTLKEGIMKLVAEAKASEQER